MKKKNIIKYNLSSKVLDIDIILENPLENVQDFTINIYTSAYHFMGGNTWRMAELKENARQEEKALHLQLESGRDWLPDYYRVHICCDFKPVWFAELPLGKATDRNEVELRDMRPMFFESYLARDVFFTEWWKGFQNSCEDKEFIKDFLIKTLKAIVFPDCISSKALREPCQFIVGNHYQMQGFPKALCLYLAEDNAMKCTSIKMHDLSQHRYSWEEMQENILAHEIVHIDLNLLESDSHGIALQARLMEDIHRDTYKGIKFVFSGFPQTYAKMEEASPLLSLYKKESNTYLLPYTEKTSPSIKTLNPEAACSRHELKMPASGPDFNAPDLESVSARLELDSLIGLEKVKAELKDAGLVARFNKERKALGLYNGNGQRNHMLFFGNPGTGKTTVARLVGRIYYQMGLLSSGHTVITDRSRLIGSYIGQTEKQTCEAMEEARGGVLFIDEAYTLIPSADDDKDYGKEVINSLLTLLSEPDPDMIIILAGYEEKMKTLFDYNPGLTDRFPVKLHFEDYTAAELTAIAERLLAKMNFELADAAKEKLASFIQDTVQHKAEDFGNARWVHNLVENHILKCMARRVMGMPALPEGPEIFKIIHLEDVALGCAEMQAYTLQHCGEGIRKIGFGR